MIETIVSLAVLGLFFAAIVLLFQQVLETLGYARVRATALQIAQSKMETIRNLPYADIGTAGGIPQGNLPQSEIVTVNGLPFTITTSVIFIDDPFDGISPSDLINTDYKRIRVEITWGGLYPSRVPVTFVTNASPKGTESLSSGGTLFIQVFNANGQPIPNATVSIDNTTLVPEIHIQTLTNTNGLVVLPGTPACVSCYRIAVTKQGYSSDRTYSSTEVANPSQPYATVIEGQTTQTSFAIDQGASITVRSYDTNYFPVSNVIFTLKGSKIIGYDTDDLPVLKYSYTTNTGGGSVTVPALEWDVYTLDFSDSAHNLAGSNPTLPIPMPPGMSVTLSAVTVPKSNNSLLLVIKNQLGELQSSVSARLTNVPLGYDVTKTTAATGSADFGQTFFGSLNVGSYDLLLSLSGYTEATASLSVSGITQENFSLNPYEP